MKRAEILEFDCFRSFMNNTLNQLLQTAVRNTISIMVHGCS